MFKSSLPIIRNYFRQFIIVRFFIFTRFSWLPFYMECKMQVWFISKFDWEVNFIHVQEYTCIDSKIVIIVIEWYGLVMIWNVENCGENDFNIMTMIQMIVLELDIHSLHRYLRYYKEPNNLLILPSYISYLYQGISCGLSFSITCWLL